MCVRVCSISKFGPVKFPCGVCEKPVGKNDRALECEACSYWVHIKCGGITPNEDKNFQKNTYLSWECPKCLLPNLSDSFFLDNPIELNNPYESLSSNSNTSITDDTQDINTHRSNNSIR